MCKSSISVSVWGRPNLQVMWSYAKIELAPPTFREFLQTPGLITKAVRQDFGALTPKVRRLLRLLNGKVIPNLDLEFVILIFTGGHVLLGRHCRHHALLLHWRSNRSPALDRLQDRELLRTAHARHQAHGALADPDRCRLPRDHDETKEVNT